MNKAGLTKLILLKAKYAISSLTASSVDYALYNLCYYFFSLPAEISNLISYPVGALVNFGLQKKFVFELNRKTRVAFMYSMMITAGGLALSTLFLHLLNRIEFFEIYQPITKLIVMGCIFFYNFYLKRYAFEKRFL